MTNEQFARTTIAHQWIFQATYRTPTGNHYISGTVTYVTRHTLNWVLKQAKQFHPNADAVEVTIGPDEVR